MYEATGTIKVIFDEQSFPSGFTKREFVVTTEHDRFPQDLKFELVKDKCGLIEPFNVGQQVAVNFDLRGNEYNGRYFVNLSAWKIQSAGEGNAGGTPPAAGGNRAQAARSVAAVDPEPSPSDLRNDDDFDDEDVPF